MGASGLEIVLRLAVSLGLVVGGLLAVKRFGRRTGRAARGAITVEARAGLAKGASIAVVAVAGQRFLLGVSEHAVSLVAELDAEHALDGTTAATPATPATPTTSTTSTISTTSTTSTTPAPAPGAGDPLAAQDAPDLEWDLDALAGAIGHGATSGPRSGLVTRLQRMTLRSATSPDRALVD